ncbi:MAG: hypothetical protein L0Z73_05870 [Gammaproteobacteria bacterium]|nr:hypothetical protein [Gammaproteobacteria bacterium]
MKILVTGFKSREGSSNASEILVSSLMNELPGSIYDYSKNIEFRIVGDSTDTIKEELTGLLKIIAPQFCVFTGQAPGRNNITLESVATNYRFTGAPLKIGEAPPGGPVEEKGHAAYMATLPNMKGIIENIKEAGIPAAISNNGGNSLCNQILYHGLHHAAENNSAMKCGFVHIPALPEQVITQWPQYPFMPLEMSRRATGIVIRELCLNQS